MVFVWVDDRFLLVRSSYRKQWSVPGGMAGRKETWIDAARRELLEEVMRCLGRLVPAHLGALQAAVDLVGTSDRQGRDCG